MAERGLPALDLFPSIMNDKQLDELFDRRRGDDLSPPLEGGFADAVVARLPEREAAPGLLSLGAWVAVTLAASAIFGASVANKHSHAHSHDLSEPAIPDVSAPPRMAVFDSTTLLVVR